MYQSTLNYHARTKRNQFPFRNECGRFSKMVTDTEDYAFFLQASEQIEMEIKSAKSKRASRTD
jgi:hypothetical protein